MNNKVAIVGFGVEGRSTYRYFTELEAEVTIVDQNEALNDLPDDANTILGQAALDNLDEFDLLCRSPSVRPDLLPEGVEVTSLTSEFFKNCPAPIIAVTGTKGKGTTVTLIAKILEAAGKKVHLVGNIGRPALDVLNDIKAEDIVVYEISSFQLWDLKQSPHVGVVLMVEIDHQDVHSNLQEYVDAKKAIAKFQKTDDVIIYHPDNQLSQEIAESGEGSRHRYMSNEAATISGETITIDGQAICTTSEVGLIGPHNLENICAAITAAWQYTSDEAAIKTAITEFKGLEHRLEFVRELAGVKYYNDSFSSAPPATTAAVKSFSEDIVLIVGGKEKGADFKPVSDAIAEASVKQTLLIGETAPSLQKMLAERGYANFEMADGDMTKIVERAKAAAQSGDVVVLSPGTSSFDMFDSYKQRGKLFKEAVNEL